MGLSFGMSVLFAVLFVVFAFFAFLFAMLVGEVTAPNRDAGAGTVGMIILLCLAFAVAVHGQPGWPIWAPTIGILTGAVGGIREVLKERRIRKEKGW